MQNFIFGVMATLIALFAYKKISEPRWEVGQYCRHGETISSFKLVSYSSEKRVFRIRYTDGKDKGRYGIMHTTRILHCEDSFDEIADWVRNNREKVIRLLEEHEERNKI